jgi:hypothetical protein
MLSQQTIEEITKRAMEDAGVKAGNSVSADSIHKGVAAAIYEVLESDDFKRVIDRVVGELIHSVN